MTDGDALLSEAETQGDVPETNDDSSDFTIKNGVLTKYNGAGGNVVIPDGVTSIGRYAFMKNDSLKSVTIPDSVTELDIYAFAYCPNLISVKMMEGLKSIGDFAFAGCSGLKNIAIPKSVTVMGDEVFVECSSLESITVPGNVKSQFFWTFMHCTNLKHVTLEEGIMTIGKSEFSGCSNLTDIDIPGTLTSIDERAFYDCEKLKSIKLPDNLVSIGKNAFDSCKSLTTVVIPRQISDIKDQAFIRCSSLESVTIPEGVTRIGEAAFNGCNKLSSVTIPASVTKIGEAAFAGAITIKGYTGSYAETYAKKNKLTFVPLDAPAPEISIPKKLSLGVKETYKLGVKNATFKSSKAAVATVDKKGVITAKKKGTATITVTVKGQKAKKCKVTVLAAPKSIKLSGKSRKMSVGDVIMLMPTLPKKTASKIKWTSSNKSVATVDADGVVRALKKGKAKITAKTFNGKKAVCTVTVGTWPSSVTFDVEAVSIGVKEQLKLKPIVNEGAKTTYTWSVKNNKIAKVSKKGVVTGVKAGTTTVTVKTQNDLTATVKVTVAAAPKKITLNKKKATLPVNQTLQLKATLPKKTASQIKWTTSKKKVATVDETGLVTAVAPGKATITAKTANGKKATCVVMVKEETDADHIESFWDVYESSDQVTLDTKDMTVKMLSPSDFKDSEGMAEFIEEYNGLAALINENSKDYLDIVDKMEHELSDFVDSIGVLNIQATKDTIQIKTGSYSFTIPTDFSAIAANKGMSKEAFFVSNVGGPSAEEVEPKNIEAYVKSAQEFVDKIGKFVSGCSILVDAEDAKLATQVDYYRNLRDTIKTKLKSKDLTIEDRAELNKKLKDVVAKYDKWKNKRIDYKNKILDNLEKFKAKQIEIGLALGSDLAHAGSIIILFSHRHPKSGREEDDAVRIHHVTLLDEYMGEAAKYIGFDVLYNVAVIATELMLFGKGGLIKSLGTNAAKKMGKKYFILSGEKWAKVAFSGGTLWGGSKLDFLGKADKASSQAEHEDDILHGEIRGTISGKVIDANTKKPIAGALVETDEKSKTTGADGFFVLSAMYGDYKGKYAVKCTKEGYVDGTGEVTVDEDASDAEVTIELSVEGVPIDEAHFPDANFRIKVREFDLDGNESLSDEEIEKITAVVVEDFSIESLEGIKYFTSMQKLSCARNALKKLDIMECGALRELDCSENLFLTNLIVARHQALQTLNCSDNPLTTLDVSWCPKLKTVYCTTTYESESSGKLMGLNASGCSELNLLDCSHNVLTLLDVGGCTALQTLDCSYNRLTSITTSGVSSGSVLSLNGCTALQELRCYNNQLTSLSVKGCAGLKKLLCNFNKLTGLDVGGMAKLTDLNCGDNQLTSLNVGGCTALQVLNCSVNKLKALDISACPSLQELYCTSNQIEVLNYLDIKRLKVAQYDDGTRVVVPFGHYDQDANPSNGKEPIEWLVLEDKGDTLTLISRYGLDAKPYHNEYVDITWANCTLRSWLNGTFLNAAFTSAEQGKIQTVRVTAEDNPYYGTEAGSDTYDKVWLLSCREAENLFSSDAARVCYPTETAIANGCWVYGCCCDWWLRSPGHYSSDAAMVSLDGQVYGCCAPVKDNRLLVRPVVCLRLS